MDRQLAKVATATEADIQAFYNNNPARFKSRKQYEFHEFNLQANKDQAIAVNKRLANPSAPVAFEQWLIEQGISQVNQVNSVGSDELNDDMLKRLKSSKPGTSLVLDGDSYMKVVFVLNQRDAAMTLAEASPLIARQILDRRRAEALDALFKRVRDAGKVDYVPPYNAMGYLPQEEEKND
jgi:hypothetical protein